MHRQSFELDQVHTLLVFPNRNVERLVPVGGRPRWRKPLGGQDVTNPRFARRSGVFLREITPVALTGLAHANAKP